MRSRGGLAVCGAILVCVAAGWPAGAEPVPLPVPAPHSKVRVTASATPATPNKPTAVRVRKMAQVTGTPVPPTALPSGKPAAASTKSGGPPFDATQRALVERINGYLSGLNTLVGNFVQIGPDGGRAEGTFYLHKPGRVRFEYNPPSPVELISDGSSIAVRDRRLATQEIIPLSQTPLRFLVADRIDLFKDTSVVGISSDDTFATVTVEERQALGGTHRLILMFGARDLQLRQWTITDAQGFDTTVALFNLDAKQKPDPSLFKIDYTRYLQ